MRIIVGVSGGIAAYKSAIVVSSMVQRGHQVQILMTEGATRFIQPLTFEALSGRPVGVSVTDQPAGPISHVKLGKWADVLAVVPATVGIMSRLALGEPTDLLSLTYMSYRGPVVIAPAMEPKMWLHPRTQEHVAKLAADEAQIVGPVEGHVASGDEGMGRLADPEFLVRAIEHAPIPKALSGIHVLVTGGATWEHFDPVRAITNPSTGRMGFEMAQEAAFLGARVTYIHGPRGADFGTLHPSVTSIPIVSAKEMRDAVWNIAESASIVVAAAAVSDFRPISPAKQKLHKSEITAHWDVTANPDILAELGQEYGGRKFLVGFAAETDNVVASAQSKLAAKHLDAIVANPVGANLGFGHWEHRAQVIDRFGGNATINEESKEISARKIWERLVDLFYREPYV
ncbi:MAG: bifunctional phosphopantothenoylcysteine decarboxylase/phosphopantothenate--cysteine ligase CoaBC [Sulfobacillus benefaciens]|uniref:Coenzyme A biosynthesis bifunctional protein CoaBC n=1 Tax=Sulfobacillus benefaciens TaxID=453960 RepID=A0A2T2XJV2_9FIRM|nr:MAG: bifunctional phosphopantothenoylcysteine decarboxylase/phosphopantothenate--cysteine ligase CoaBC [Sulfobacillus benefaciens]